MPKLASVALVVIAALLAAEVIVDRLIPALVLQLTQGRYKATVIECERARDAARTFGPGLTGDKRTDERLQKSVNVQLLSCLHQEVLRNRLLSSGIPKSSIRLVELDVIAGTADVRYDDDHGLRQ